MIMITKIQFIIVFFLSLISIKSYSQINFHWQARYNGSSNTVDEAKAIITDDSGCIYVTGYSFNTGSFDDFTTIKYTPTGQQVWTAIFNGAGNSYDQASLIAMDSSGNVFVSGYITGMGSSNDFATVKYNSDGIEQWAAFYNGPGNGIDYVTSLVIDGGGNVYVTGQSYGGSTSSYDYATIKYNSAGVRQWISRFNGTANGNDGATSVDVDTSGNVYVTGYSLESGAESLNYATVKYNSSGIEQWAAKYNGTGNGIDGANSVKADKSGNVYVTGYSRGLGTLYDIATVKYDTAGVQKWAVRYNGAVNGDDGANCMILDDSGNVYITGYSVTGSALNDYATIKYDSSGVRKWIAVYNGPANQSDSATSIAIDDAGSICVTGYSTGVGTLGDCATIKYNSDGAQEWSARFDGGINGNDVAHGVTFDPSGDVYVAAKSTGTNSSYDFVTLKYSKTSGIHVLNSSIDNGYKLYENYPNPFNPSTKISFNIPKSSFVKLNVFDITGKEVGILVNEKLEAGLYEVTFNPVGMPSKMYFYRLWVSTASGKAADFVQTKKMIFIK